MEAAQPPGVGADRGSALLPQGPGPGTEQAYAAPQKTRHCCTLLLGTTSTRKPLQQVSGVV